MRDHFCSGDHLALAHLHVPMANGVELAETLAQMPCFGILRVAASRNPASEIGLTSEHAVGLVLAGKPDSGSIRAEVHPNATNGLVDLMVGHRQNMFL